MAEPLTNLEIYPLTPERWHDFEVLFGPHGAYSGCWCMWWRLPRKEFSAKQGEGNRLGLKALVDGGSPTGLLAYLDGVPSGWIAVAPREDFASLERSTVLKRIDAQPVWSIVCFYIGRKARRRGLMSGLIQAAVDFAAAHGATMVEAYPMITGENAAPVSTFMGNLDAFLKAGFVEVARPKPKRPILRRVIAASA